MNAVDTWARLVREGREARGLSLRKLAEVTGVSVTLLSRMESGERVGTLGMVVTVADHLGVDLNALKPDPDDIPRPVGISGSRIYEHLVDGVVDAELLAALANVPVSDVRTALRRIRDAAHHVEPDAPMPKGVLRMRVYRHVSLGETDAGRIAEILGVPEADVRAVLREAP